MKASFVPKSAAAPKLLPPWVKAAAPVALVAKPQLELACKQSVPLASGKLMVRAAVSAVVLSVDTKPFVAVASLNLIVPAEGAARSLPSVSWPPVTFKLLLMVVMPVAAPTDTMVAAPAKLTVVAPVLNKFCVVAVPRIDPAFKLTVLLFWIVVLPAIVEPIKTLLEDAAVALLPMLIVCATAPVVEPI